MWRSKETANEYFVRKIVHSINGIDFTISGDEIKYNKEMS